MLQKEDGEGELEAAGHYRIQIPRITLCCKIASRKTSLAEIYGIVKVRYWHPRLHFTSGFKKE